MAEVAKSETLAWAGWAGLPITLLAFTQRPAGAYHSAGEVRSADKEEVHLPRLFHERNNTTVFSSGAESICWLFTLPCKGAATSFKCGYTSLYLQSRQSTRVQMFLSCKRLETIVGRHTPEYLQKSALSWRQRE